MVAWYLSRRPYYNWDLFPYMALTVQSNQPFDSTHAFIYKMARDKMPASDYEALMKRQPELAQNSLAFQDALRYFRIKPLYLFITRTLYRLGVDPVTATWLPSVISYVLMGCILFLWLQKFFAPPLSAIATLLFATTPFTVTPARYSSPDAMAALITFLGLFLISESSMALGVLVSFLAIAIRPDAALMMVPICVALYQSKKTKRIYIIVAFLLSVSTALVISGGTGMAAEYLFTTTDYSTGWTFGERARYYGEGLIGGLGSLAHSGMGIFLWMGITTMIFINHATTFTNERSGFWWWIVAATMATFMIRYFLHPAIEDRFLLSGYLLIFVGFCKTLETYLPSKLKAALKP